MWRTCQRKRQRACDCQARPAPRKAHPLPSWSTIEDTIIRPPEGPFLNLSKPKINALLALALFTFAFLAAEFRFDINIGLLAGA